METNNKPRFQMQGQLLALGALIKINRKKLNRTQSSLSRGICASSYLSKIENGEIEANEEVIYLLLNELGIKYHNLEDFTMKDQERLIEYRRLVFLYDIPNAFLIFEELMNDKERYTYSPLIVDFFLIEYHYCLYNNPKSKRLRHLLEILSSIEQLLNREQQAFFYYMKSISSTSLEDKKCFINKAITLESLGRFHKELSVTLIGLGAYNDAIETLHTSIDLCIREGNFRGIAYANLTLGEVYYIIEDYEKAENYYDRNISLIVSSGTKNKYTCSFIYYSYVNKASISFLTGDSELLMKYCNLAKEYELAWDGKIHGVLHYLIMCEHYLDTDLGKAEEMLDFIKENMSRSVTADYVIELGMVSLFEHRIMNDMYLMDKSYLNKLKAFKKEIVAKGRYHYLNYINKKLIEYYIANKKYKDAFLISSKNKSSS